MTSKAFQEFDKLSGFVDQLIKIHGRLQQGQGRRYEQDALHRAGVVMTVAAWESYIERLVLEALDAIEASAGVAGGQVPVPQWAKHAFALRRAEIKKAVKKFNTPESTNVRDLLGETLEFDPWNSWSWHEGPRQWGSKEMRERLNDWVKIRHSVAHGFSLPTDVTFITDSKGRARLTLTLLRECKKFFAHVVKQTDSGVAGHLVSHHGLLAPW